MTHGIVIALAHKFGLGKGLPALEFLGSPSSFVKMVWGLIIAIIIPLGLGFASSYFAKGDKSWYQQLRKPEWTPPDKAFPIIWTILYILMGISSWLIWKDGGFQRHAFPLVIYIIQLVLNLIWTPIFSFKRQIGYALVDIVALWVFVLVTILVFWSVNHAAAYLLIPYIIWVAVAVALNYSIWVNNRNDYNLPLSI